MDKIIERHKQTVSTMLQHYEGKVPLHLYLKQYFAAHKQHGSRDRKMITSMIYGYFRLGGNIAALEHQGVALSDILDMGNYISGLCPFPASLRLQLQSVVATQKKAEKQINDPAATALAEEEAARSPQQRFKLLQKCYPCLQQRLLFPFKAPLSKGLQRSATQQNILVQPPVFLRIRPIKGGAARVLKTLTDHQIAYRLYDQYTLSLPPNTPLQQLLDINKTVVIQDSSSQWMQEFMGRALAGLQNNHKTPIKVWDCCAASGGKSILLYDLAYELGQKLALWVTDIRPTILQNLRTRFKRAGIHPYRDQELDLLSPAPLPFNTDFDLVICDAPCSGSGTWARNPEHIRFFTEKQIQAYYQRQTAIASKAWQAVAPGGYFLYMTCSVFAQENEAVAEFITANSGMELILAKVVTGWPENRVSMFGALYCRKK